MAAGETFKATMICEGNIGTAFVYDFGYADLTGGSFHIDTTTAAGAFQTLVQTTWASILPDVVSFKRYRFACVLGAHIGEVGFVDVSPPVIGSLSGSQPLPGEMCISFKRNTGHVSRRDRGRVFFGPVDQPSFQGNTNPDLVSSIDVLQPACNLLKANLTVSGVVLSPVILAANGTFTGRKVINVSVGEEFVHRKTRRFRIGA